MDKKLVLSGIVGGLVALLGKEGYENYTENNPRTKEGRVALIRHLAEEDVDLISVLQNHEQLLLKHEEQLKVTK